MDRLKACIFDLDGIVADTEPHQTACYLRAFRELGCELSEEEYVEKVILEGVSTRDLFREFGGDDQRFEAELLPVKDECYFRRMEAEMEPREGLLELLDDLHENGVATPICTSSRNKNAEKLLGEFGIRDRFEFVLGLDDVLRSKPDPEVYLTAVQKLDIPHSTVVAIEDTPKGVRSAAGAGVRAIACPTGTTEGADFSEAWREVHSLTELSYRWIAAELESDLEKERSG